MTDELAKRLLDTVIFVTEKYWGYNILDICSELVGDGKLTSEELVKYWSPRVNYEVIEALKKKYINRPSLEKLITHYETFLDVKKKA